MAVRQFRHQVDAARPTSMTLPRGLVGRGLMSLLDPEPPPGNGHDTHAAWINRGREAGWLEEGAEQRFLSKAFRAALEARDKAAQAWLREGREHGWIKRSRFKKLYIPD